MTTPDDLPWTAALTTPALTAVNGALAEAGDPADFLGRVDVILRRPGALNALAVDHGAPEPLDASTRQGGIDVENAVSVHRYLGAMDRANAASAPFWTYTAFVTYRDYMEERWPLHGLKKEDSWRSRARDRWLLLSPSRGKLIRHGVARLWWVADLTVDMSQQHPLSIDDPYGYTRETFKNEDRIINIFDREVGAIPTLMRAVLERAAAGGHAAKDEPFRNLMRAFTLIDGYREVAMLEESALAGLVESLGEQLAG
jgi:hypothetical protein